MVVIGAKRGGPPARQPWLRYLDLLARNPHREIGVLDMVQLTSSSVGGASVDGLTVMAGDRGDEVLDAQVAPNTAVASPISTKASPRQHSGTTLNAPPGCAPSGTSSSRN